MTPCGTVMLRDSVTLTLHHQTTATNYQVSLKLNNQVTHFIARLTTFTLFWTGLFIVCKKINGNGCKGNPLVCFMLNLN